jgi:DNA-binding MarR family transcriptional regulator
MVQAIPGTAPPAADALVAAMFALGARLKRMQIDEPIEKAGVAVLHQLACHGDGLRLSDVAAEMQLDVSTVSRHVRHLEDAGLVERTGDPDDRRASLLNVTDAGRTTLQAAYDARARAIRTALAGWSDDERTTLTALLTRLEADLGRPVDEKDS